MSIRESIAENIIRVIFYLFLMVVVVASAAEKIMGATC